MLYVLVAVVSSVVTWAVLTPTVEAAVLGLLVCLGILTGLLLAVTTPPAPKRREQDEPLHFMLRASGASRKG